jgi:hypothetical protein
MAKKLFEKGNKGKPKGAVSHTTALKNMLEEVFRENPETCKAQMEALIADKRGFKWLCDLKAQFELKTMPIKGEGFEHKSFILQYPEGYKKPDVNSPSAEAVPSRVY